MDKRFCNDSILSFLPPNCVPVRFPSSKFAPPVLSEKQFYYFFTTYKGVSQLLKQSSSL